MKNVHLVKNEISNLKNEDFNIKKEEKELNNNNNTKIKFYSLGFVTSFILFGIYYVTKKIQLRNIKK
jgi:hypothetical protein